MGDEIALEDTCFMFSTADSDEEDRVTAVVGTSELKLKYDVYVRHSEPKDPRLPLDDGLTNASSIIKMALIARHHSLWAEYVYNAARVVADLMDNSPFVSAALPRIDVSGKTCLELGAGAGLPGIMAILKGAKRVVISDYGHDLDLSLIYPIDVNINMIRDRMGADQEAYAVGYIWGYPIEVLCDVKNYYQRSEMVDTFTYTSYLQSKKSLRIQYELSPNPGGIEKFDVIILADLIFNRSEHSKLLWTVKNCLKIDGICWVSYSHHDPQKSSLDLNFFELAKQDPFNLKVSYVGKEIRQTYPFREEDGMDEQRGVVYLYTVTL